MENTSPEAIAKASTEKAAAQIEKASASTQKMVGQAADAALAATERLGAAGAQVASTAGRLTDATRDRVRRSPIASLGVAVGVALGMALGAGWLYQRREHRRWDHSHSH